jgi:hypothetical protein
MLNAIAGSRSGDERTSYLGGWLFRNVPRSSS